MLIDHHGGKSQVQAGYPAMMLLDRTGMTIDGVGMEVVAAAPPTCKVEAMPPKAVSSTSHDARHRNLCDSKPPSPTQTGR